MKRNIEKPDGSLRLALTSIFPPVLSNLQNCQILLSFRKVGMGSKGILQVKLVSPKKVFDMFSLSLVINRNTELGGLN